MAPSCYSRASLGDMEQTVVAVKVGPEEEVFLVHKDILCKQSPYFKAALSKNWKEEQENAITLEDAELHIFKDIIMGWLYTGELPDPEIDNHDMVKAYVFTDRFDIPELRGHILALLHDCWNHGLSRYEQIIYAFDNLPESSKLCEMIVDFYGARWMPCADDDEEAEERQSLPVSFLLRLMPKLGGRASRDRGMPGIGYYRESA